MSATCPMCKAQLAEGSQFCHKCGVPLTDQCPRAPGGRSVAWARRLVAATLAVYFVAWLGCWATAEAGLGFGLVNLALCAALIALGVQGRYPWAWGMGVAHCALFAFLFVLVVVNGWSPPRAQGPFIGIGFIYLVTATPLTVRAWRSAPTERHPMMCGKCGYLLYGLTQARCPECGTPFDPKLLAKLNPSQEEPAAPR